MIIFAFSSTNMLLLLPFFSFWSFQPAIFDEKYEKYFDKYIRYVILMMNWWVNFWVCILLMQKYDILGVIG